MIEWPLTRHSLNLNEYFSLLKKYTELIYHMDADHVL